MTTNATKRKSKKRSFYNPASNGEAMREALRKKGLREEIALLRVTLRNFVEQENPDEGLILSAVNALGRALMAQARLGGQDPASAAASARLVLRRMGVMLTEDSSAEPADGPAAGAESGNENERCDAAGKEQDSATFAEQ